MWYCRTTRAPAPLQVKRGISEAASLFHWIQLSLHTQMKDTHKTNNPGYFLKLIAQKEGERTQLFQLPAVLSPGRSEPSSQAIEEPFSSLTTIPSPLHLLPLFVPAQPPHLLRMTLLCQACKPKCTHKARGKVSPGQWNGLKVATTADRGEGLLKAKDTQHPLHFLTSISSRGGLKLPPTAHLMLSFPFAVT